MSRSTLAFVTLMSVLCAASVPVTRADDAFTSAEFEEARLRRSWDRLGRELELREVDAKAMAHVEAFEKAEDSVEPVAGPNGRVLFYFGAQVPRVACRPLSVCDIEFEEGERLVDAFLGDQQRWQMATSVTGSGDNARQHLLIKPMAPAAIETNLVVHTDRRAYQIDLVSPADPPMRFVSFQYPKSARDLFGAALAETGRGAGQGTTGKREAFDEYRLDVEPTKLHMDYTVEAAGRRRVRKNIAWVPDRVFDDGEKTFIRLPPSVLSRERPILLVQNGAGEFGPTEYRVKGRMFVVDRVFEQAWLVLGSGRRQERVVIQREP